MLCSLVQANRSFGGKYHLHLQNHGGHYARTKFEAKTKQEQSLRQATSSVPLLHQLTFSDYLVLYHRREFFTATDVRTLNCISMKYPIWMPWHYIYWRVLSPAMWHQNGGGRMLSSVTLRCVNLLTANVPPKCQFLQETYGITSQKTAFFIVTAVKTS
jgi:hypothetical protein